jgi:hypothetical protein
MSARTGSGKATPPQTVDSAMAPLPFARWHRHSRLCASAAPRTHRLAGRTISQPAKFLIANPRLEFRASPTKQSAGLKSNRERIAIFRLDPQNKTRARVTHPSISNRYIRQFKVSVNSPAITTYAVSNRYKIAFSGIPPFSSTPSLLPPLPCPRMSVFASLRAAQAATRREPRP